MSVTFSTVFFHRKYELQNGPRFIVTQVVARSGNKSAPLSAPLWVSFDFACPFRQFLLLSSLKLENTVEKSVKFKTVHISTSAQK